MIETSGLFSNFGQPVPLQGVSVTGDILGAGARVTIGQRYRNKEARAIEAIYKFPLPEGAAVCGFRVHLEGRVVAGRVEEKEKAYKVYDETLGRGDGAYLLEQERPNIFTLYVGNLNPAMDVLVEIDYVTLLDREGNNLRFFLPTTISPRYIPDRMPERDGIPEAARIHPEYAQEVPYGLSLALNIHGAVSIQAVESPSHLLKIEIGEDPVKVGFYSDTVRLDRDFILVCRLKEGVRSRAFAFRAGPETFLQLDLLPEEPQQGDAASGAPNPPGLDQEVVFLLDCSGSMAGDSIGEAKNALEISLRALPEGALFNIVCFGSTFDALFEKPRELDAERFEQARLYLETTGADLGGTELLPPLQAILKRPPRRSGRVILLITDGEVGNEEEIIRLMDRHRESARLFTIGIGAGPNEYLVKALSRTGGGACEFIYPGERIEPKVLRIFGKALRPVVVNPVIHWGAGTVQAPETPALFPGHPATVFARLESLPLPERVRLEGEIDGEPAAWEIEVSPADKSGSALPVLWARERIRDLEDRIIRLEHVHEEKRSAEDREHLKKELITISRTYGVLSRETDFLAVEERAEVDKTVGVLMVRKAPSLVTAGWHGISALRDPGLSYGLAAGRTTHKMASYSIPIDRSRSKRETVCLERVSYEHDISFSLEQEFLEESGSGSDDILYLLLNKQHVGGGFAIEEHTADMLGLNFPELVELAETITLSGDGDRWLLLSTALVLHILETRYGDQRSIWEGLVEKSAHWLQKQVKKNGAAIQGRDLVAWAGEFLKDE